MDAGFLQAINDGVRLRRGDEPIGGYVTYRGETYWTNGGQGWFEFFDGHDPEIHNDRNFVDHELTIIRFSAEQQGANYSRVLPETQRRLQGASLGEQVKVFSSFLGLTDTVTSACIAIGLLIATVPIPIRERQWTRHS